MRVLRSLECVVFGDDESESRVNHEHVVTNAVDSVSVLAACGEFLKQLLAPVLLHFVELKDTGRSESWWNHLDPTSQNSADTIRLFSKSSPCS
jgi:hypothetical protein